MEKGQSLTANAEAVFSRDTGQSQPQPTEHYLALALNEARRSPPKPTNFRVGACVVSPSTRPEPLLMTGYTLESKGNTHAEQSCFIKLAERLGCAELEIGPHLPHDCVLYTTMEPCNRRSLGNTPCVDRILKLRRKDGKPAITKVFVGVLEPNTFVSVNDGAARLQDAGIEVIHVTGMEEEILAVAKAGHPKGEDEAAKAGCG